MDDRYGADVLAAGWREKGFATATEVPAAKDLVVEVAQDGYCGAITRVEAGMVELEDWKGRRRSFPLGGGFMIDGKPVRLVPAVAKPAGRARTASGSFAVADDRARTALPSRILVEGRHDAELVEKVWGDDLRIEGVVVEYLEGVDHLPSIVTDFAPGPDARLGVLVDHLVPGSKEFHIARSVTSDHALVVGHPYIDIWEAVKPASLGIPEWPRVPRGQDWKTGVCRALGWPSDNTGAVWQAILKRVHSYKDLEPELLGRVEELIDFVTGSGGA